MGSVSLDRTVKDCRKCRSSCWNFNLELLKSNIPAKTGEVSVWNLRKHKVCMTNTVVLDIKLQHFRARIFPH